MPQQTTHTIIGVRKEGWIMYACPECGYQLWDRWSTGEINVLNDTNPSISHEGVYVDADFQTAMSRMN